MSRQAESSVPEGFPAFIDSLEFAAQSRVVEAKVPVGAFPRLRTSLARYDGELNCRIAGERQGDGKSWLTLAVSGTLSLSCQRCLAEMAVPLHVESRLLLVPPGKSWPEEELTEDAYDAVPGEKEMALLPLIEEEVLLVLPLAPRHETCETPATVADEYEPSPFAVLARFRKGV